MGQLPGEGRGLAHEREASAGRRQPSNHALCLIGRPVPSRPERGATVSLLRPSGGGTSPKGGGGYLGKPAGAATGAAGRNRGSSRSSRQPAPPSPPSRPLASHAEGWLRLAQTPGGRRGCCGRAAVRFLSGLRGWWDPGPSPEPSGVEVCAAPPACLLPLDSTDLQREARGKAKPQTAPLSTRALLVPDSAPAG